MTFPLLLAAITFSLALGQTVFPITSYGARNDGVTLNTRAIASAFAAAHASFVSTRVPAVVLVSGGGAYLSGQVVLLSGCTLRVDSGTRLLASANASHYPSNTDLWAFLYSDGAEDIGIDGGGEIDGNYQAYIGGFDPLMDRFIVTPWDAAVCNPSGSLDSECRPRLCKLTSSSRIIIRDVTFTGSPDWTTHIVNCSHVHIANWTQHGDERWPNNDGLDLDSTSHVLVEDSTLDTADDGICIKGSAGPMTNVTVRRTRVRSRSSAIKFGSNTGPSQMSEMLFEDILVHDSNRGLAIQARDGGLVVNITFRRILINGTRFWPTGWWGDGSPLYISTMLRTAADPGARVRNITFEDIVAYSQSGAVFSGLAPGGHVEGITLRNVSLIIDRWGAWNYSTTSVPPMGPNIEYDPSTVVHPTRRYETGWMSAFYAESIEGLVLDGLNVTFVNQHYQKYWGSACVNVSHAGYPVTQRGGHCTPPTPPQALDNVLSIALTIPPQDAPLVSGASMRVTFSAVLSSSAVMNVTTMRLVPYFDGVQYGAEVGFSAFDAATLTAHGDAFVPISWAASPPATLQLAWQGPPVDGPTHGSTPPASAVLSNAAPLSITLRVPVRAVPPPAPGKGSVMTLYFETWFTPHNFYWGSAHGGPHGADLAEAIPAIGRYASVGLEAMRTQAAMLVQAGVDALVIDWTNNCWAPECDAWEHRSLGIQELVNATDLAFGVFAGLRAEGWAVPKFIILLGLDNGPTTPLPALLAELDYISTAYLHNANPTAADGSAAVFILTPAVGTLSQYTPAPPPAQHTVTIAFVTARFDSSGLRNGTGLIANVTMATSIAIDGAVVAQLPAPAAPGPQTYTLDVSSLDPRFPHVLTVTALPAAADGGDHLTRWPLSFNAVDADTAGGVPLVAPVPAVATAWLWLPESQGA